MNKFLSALMLVVFITTQALATTTTTTNMNLVLPVPGSEPGPVWAQRLNTAFGLVDTHNHTSGKGVRVPTSGLNINGDLQFGNYNLVNPRSIMFTSQSAALATAADKNNVYVVNGDLYYNNSSGTAIQVTTGTTVNTSSAGNISGIGGTTAALTYNNTTKNFTFTQSSGITANISGGTHYIYENIASANGIGLKSPASLATAYDLTFPAALPASTKILTVSSTGVIGDAYDVDASTITVTANTIAIPSNVDLPGNTVKENTKNVVVSGSNAATSLAIIRGGITSGGSVSFGEGFAAANVSTGSYTIAYTPSFSDTPAVVVTPTDASIMAAIVTSSTSLANVQLFRRSDGGSVNGSFHFIAIAPR